MAEWQEVFQGIVRETFKTCGQTPEQIEVASARIRETPEFVDFTEEIVAKALKDFVYEQRAVLCQQIKNGKKNDPQWREANIPVPKVKRDAANDVYQAYYRLPFAGKWLGDLIGGDLLHIAENEGSRGRGYLAREKFLKLLKPLVPDNKTVREAVKGKQLQELAIKAGMERPPDVKASA